MLFWSDALQRAPEAAIAAAPATAKACMRCWPKCYWMHCWSEKRSRETWRSYNYPHVATTYWALYRLGRIDALPVVELAYRDEPGGGDDAAGDGLRPHQILARANAVGSAMDPAERREWNARLREAGPDALRAWRPLKDPPSSS